MCMCAQVVITNSTKNKLSLNMPNSDHAIIFAQELLVLSLVMHITMLNNDVLVKSGDVLYNQLT